MFVIWRAGGTTQPVRAAFRAKKITRDKEGHYRDTQLGDLVGSVPDTCSEATHANVFVSEKM